MSSIYILHYFNSTPIEEAQKALRLNYDNLDSLSSTFPTLQILMPTVHRNTTGYRYLYKTWDSINFYFSKFLIDFQLNVYERDSSEKQKIEITNSKFRHKYFQQDPHIASRFTKESTMKDYKNLKEMYEGITLNRIKKWKNQALDWIEMMRDFHSKGCNGANIFLYMEDDFEICENAFSHVLSLYQWGEMHLDDWLVIRMTFGFSGLLMQCRDIPTFLKIVQEKSIDQTLPIDTALAHFWDPYQNQNNKRQHYTYRYVLFEHIGFESSVGNSNERTYQCFGLMKSAVFHYQEQYDWDCENFMVSPCRNPIVKELEFRAIPTFDVPIGVRARNKLLARIGHSIEVDDTVFNGFSCDQVCESKGMKCNSIAFQFVNNCEVMRKAFNVNCRCYNMIDDESNILPIFDSHKNRCKTLINFKSECEGRRWGDQRICACARTSQEISTPNAAELARNKTSRRLGLIKKYAVHLKSLEYMLMEKNPETTDEIKKMSLQRKIIQATLEKNSPRVGPSTKSDLEKKIVFWKSQIGDLVKSET